MGGGTLAFALRIGRRCAPEIGYAIYLILERMMSEVLGISSNLSHTTTRVSPVIFAS